MSNQEEMNLSLFASLVYTFNMTAMQQLGKVVNPISNKQEKDMDQARLTIDMLIMLADRTKGNLTEAEDSFLLQTLTFLKNAFDEETKK